jgi:hypothetical protein
MVRVSYERCPARGVGVRAHLEGTVGALSILYPAHHRATKAPASVASLR